MRRAAAGCLLAVVVAGCGGHGRAREVPATLAVPQGCHVTVFFTTQLVGGREATRAEMTSLRRRLASNNRVRTYAFVSKRLAFKRMAKLQPALLGPALGNPLPPAYEIRPRSTGDARPLASELRRASGVGHVTVASSC